jgi:hypothetical protein
LSHVDDKTEIFKVVGNIFCWHVRGKVMDYYLYRLFGIQREGKVVEIIFLQVGFYGSIVCHFFCNDTGSISCISELVVLLFGVVF